MLDVVQIIQKKLYCIKKNQSSVTFPIFACANNSDKYTDAQSMRRLGDFTIFVLDPSVVDDKYSFSVSFTFGSTELAVSAVDDQTQQEAHACVVFVAE